MRIARIMAVVGVIALDCGLIRAFVSSRQGLGGLGLVGLGCSFAAIVLLVGTGRPRQLARAFLFATVVLIVATIGLIAAFPDDANAAFLAYMNAAARRFPKPVLRALREPGPHGPAPSPSERRALSLVVEAAVGVPFIATAAAGAVLLMACRGRRREDTDGEFANSPIGPGTPTSDGVK